MAGDYPFFKRTLLMMMVLEVFTGCEVQEPSVDTYVNLKSIVDFENMSNEELLEYYRDFDFSKPGVTEGTFEIIELDNYQAPARITRSSLECEFTVKLLFNSSSSTTTATVEIWENGSLYDSDNLGDGDTIKVTIDDANSYYVKVIPTGDLSNVSGSIKYGLVYGTKTFDNFSGSGTYTTSSKN